jgi:hypothetical protein
MAQSQGGAVVSHPKRYSIRGFSAAMVEEDNGVMVKWDDYAALKAENERLQELCRGYSGHNQRIIKRAMKEEVELLKLRTENKRLRKVGDELADVCGWVSLNPIDGLRLTDKWLAAKGVQS